MDLRRVITGMFSGNKTGCQWRLIPTHIGNAHTLDGSFRRLARDYEQLAETLAGLHCVACAILMLKRVVELMV